MDVNGDLLPWEINWPDAFKSTQQTTTEFEEHFY